MNMIIIQLDFFYCEDDGIKQNKLIGQKTKKLQKSSSATERQVKFERTALEFHEVEALHIMKTKL